jgi:glycosyltransferase involved in cell wall biosynthesis
MDARAAVARVDVCVPVHDPDPAYLHALLDSLRRQSVRDFDVVVSDDSAVPSLGDVVAAYRDELTIRVHREPPGQGMVHNWNCAVRLGEAPLAILLGQDDVLAPAALSEMQQALAGDSDLVACGTGRTFIDADGAPLRVRAKVNDRSRIFARESSYRLSRAELTFLDLRNGNVLGEPSAVLFRRAGYDAIGGFDPSYLHAVDVDFALRLAACGDVIYLNQPLLQRRRHPGSQTTRNIRDGVTSMERVRLINDHAVAAGLSKEDVGRVNAAAAVHSLHDIARGARLRSSDAVRVNLRLLRGLAGSGLRVRDLAAGLVEAASGRNSDAR